MNKSFQNGWKRVTSRLTFTLITYFGTGVTEVTSLSTSWHCVYALWNNLYRNCNNYPVNTSSVGPLQQKWLMCSCNCNLYSICHNNLMNKSGDFCLPANIHRYHNKHFINKIQDVCVISKWQTACFCWPTRTELIKPFDWNIRDHASYVEHIITNLVPYSLGSQSMHSPHSFNEQLRRSASHRRW